MIDAVPAVTVRIPTPLRPFTGGQDEVRVQGRSVGEVLVRLAADHPDLADRLLGADGEVRPFVNVFLGEQDIRRREGLKTPVGTGAVLTILPAVAGGQS